MAREPDLSFPLFYMLELTDAQHRVCELQAGKEVSAYDLTAS